MSSSLLLLFRRDDSLLIDYNFTEGLLPSGTTFTRVSAGTYFNASGVLVAVTDDVARFNYDPVSGDALGLLYEEQRENKLIYSKSIFSEWTGIGAALSEYSETALSLFDNGAVVSSGGETWHRASPPDDFYATSAVTLSWCAYYREGTSGRARIAFRYSPSESIIKGAVGALSVSQNGAGALTITKQVKLSDDTFFISGTFLPDSTGYHSFSVGPDSTVSGETAICLSAQVEEGAECSAFIVTGAAAASRAVDQLSFDIPLACTGLRYTFDDDSTQDVVVTVGAYTVPNDLNRANIKTIVAESVTSLKVIAANQTVLTDSESQALGSQATNQGYVISNDATVLNVNVSNVILAYSGQADGDNQITIESAALENEEGTETTQITFGGNRSKILSTTDYDINSDDILPSSLGVVKFSANEKYHIKMIVSVALSSDTIPFSDKDDISTSNGQILWYGASTTMSSVDEPGAFTYSGSAPVSRDHGYKAILLGRPSEDTKPSFVCVGDSISLGYAASDDNGYYGGGFFARSMTADSKTLSIPSLNLSSSGALSDTFVGANTYWKDFLKYANYAVEALGANLWGVSHTQTNLQLIWQSLRAGDIEKIVRTKLTPHALSTDSYVTEANQTCSVSWGVGGNGDQMNTWLDGKLIEGILDYLIEADSVKGVEKTKWAVDGTPNYAAHDTCHPSANGHILMGGEVQVATFDLAGYPIEVDIEGVGLAESSSNLLGVSSISVFREGIGLAEGGADLSGVGGLFVAGESVGALEGSSSLEGNVAVYLSSVGALEGSSSLEGKLVVYISSVGSAVGVSSVSGAGDSESIGVWDIGNVSTNGVKDISAQVVAGLDTLMSPAGDKIYISDNTTDTIYQYSLSTNYDVTSASYDSKSLDVSAQDSSVKGLVFRTDGTRLIIAGSGRAFQFSLSTAWDISTASYDSVSSGIDLVWGANNMYVDPTGSHMIVVNGNTDGVRHYTLSTPWDISTISYTNGFDPTPQTTVAPRGIFMNDDGTKVFVMAWVSGTGMTVYQYSLPTAWDMPTASYDSKEYLISTNAGFGLEFNSNGNKMYCNDSISDVIRQFTLS